MKTAMRITCSASHILSTISPFFTLLFLFCLSFCYARDTITSKNPISDSQRESLISAGKIFELGFFTPQGSSNNRRRYVGIWYHRSSPQTVVWVANREKPLSKTTGVFTISEDGNLTVLDDHSTVLWSANAIESTSFNMTVKLLDSGNLVFSDEDQRILWQSFDNPTDTFLPGMKINADMKLTSWTSQDDPASGNFTFQQDQDRPKQYIIKRRTIPYWKSGVSGNFISSDEMSSFISDLLLNFSRSSRPANNYEFDQSLKKGKISFSMPKFNITSRFDYSNTRLVMNLSGEIQFLIRVHKMASWSLIWSEPRDRCSLVNACGSFGSCNSENSLYCKCLPGFEPKSSENWKYGDYKEGCTRKSPICIKDVKNIDYFLNLTMMKVRNPDGITEKKNGDECREECLSTCECNAYSYETPRGSETGKTTCWTWSEELQNIQEDYTNGRDLYVRVALSDIGLLKRDCEICGTNIIPYPLSTAPNCGDPIYSGFTCNNATAQVNFRASNRTYRVTSINPERQKFSIQVQNGYNCTDIHEVEKVLQLNQSSPFSVKSGCNATCSNFNFNCSSEDGRLHEVDIGWKLPSEPICNSSKDCNSWPYSTCKTPIDGTKRCLCNENFKWDPSDVSCTPAGHELEKSHRKQNLLGPIIPVIIATLIVIACCLMYYLIRKKAANRQVNRDRNQGNAAFRLYDSERRAKDLIDSGQFKEDDRKDIDVPFFDLQSILAATEYFSDTKKLGQGGFGPVYKGTFPGGQEIAIKRLSSGSGQGLEEFKNEVVLIAKLQHRNLVRLLGYCIEGDEKMLLYEYMPNKSLDFFLFDRTLCVLLNWEIRFNIILGIARGLLYLHQDSRLRIIHRDLKTSNILLDEEMNPKISDFGLARIFGGKQTEATTTRVVGTYGYMSPEYALDGFFSVKSDAFSFGVVVLEIISGKKNTGFYQSGQALSLLGYAWKLWNEDKALELMDQSLRQSCNADEFLRCVNVGLLCVQEDPSDRPTMSNVVFMLGSETATLPSPKQPAYVLRRSSLSSTASSSSKPGISYELTNSMAEGR